MRALRATAVALVLTLSLLQPASAQDATPVLPGRVMRVVDGDTLKVQLASGPITVRLDSIDAPERNQPGGPEATEALKKLVAQGDILLEPITQDRYSRMVAVVYVGDRNVNAQLVKDGHAWTFRRYATDPDFCRWEAAARASRRGLWSRPTLDRIAPWEYRAVKRDQRDRVTDYTHETAEHCIATLGRAPATTEALLATDTETTSVPTVPQRTGECLIKGNISSRGMIYHVPGSPSYDATRIDESKGERWFCTEDQARAAGWRAPRG